MTVSFDKVQQISFTSSDKDNKRDAEKKVVTGGGAVAATATATRAKAAKSGFDMFASSKEVANGMKNVTSTAKTVNQTVKQTTSLWGKVCENAKWAKNAVLNWGSKFKNMKYIRPLVENPVFRGAAGFLGYGFGVVTLISGCFDIAKVASDAAQGHLLDKNA